MPIRIICLRPGMFRAGVQHPEALAEYPDGHFTEAQLKAIRDDKAAFKVEIVPSAPNGGNGNGKGNGAKK